MFAAELIIGHDQAHDGKAGPLAQAPVEIRILDRIARGFRRAARHVVVGRVQIMQHRLGHAVEDEADAKAGGQQHADPGKEAVFGFAVRRTETDLAVAATRQNDEKHHETEYREQIEPAEVMRYRIQCVAGDVSEAFGKDPA